MVWFKVDDGLADHPKTVLAGNAAMGLWVRAGSWSAKHLTEGLIPAHMIPVLGNRAQAKALVRAGFWLEDLEGFRFHEWSEDGRQPTKASVLAEREAARKRQRDARDRAASRRDSGVSHTDVTPAVTVPPTRPDPTRPSKVVVHETSGGTTGAPPLFCPKHPSGTDGPCRPCGDARRAHEAWLLAEKTKPSPSIRAPKLGDGHDHHDDGNGFCPLCGERA